MKRAHTHTGNCQVCGRKQAIECVGPGDGFNTGKLAKHGYKVAGFSYFVGTCEGSGEQALQLQHVITDDICNRLTEYAARQLKFARQLESGEVVPEQVRVGQKRQVVNNCQTLVDVYVAWAEALEHKQKEQVKRDIYKHENNAHNAKSHVEFLIEMKKKIYGTALVPVKKEKPIEIKPGLRFSNSKGDTFEVIKMVNGRFWRCRMLVELAKEQFFTVSNVTIRSYVKAERNRIGGCLKL